MLRAKKLAAAELASVERAFSRGQRIFDAELAAALSSLKQRPHRTGCEAFLEKKTRLGVL